MQTVNPYELLSESINDGIGNTSTQIETVAELFINELFTSDNCMKIETVKGENGLEYHIDFDGFKQHGSTPAKALSAILWEMSAEISGARHGYP